MSAGTGGVAGGPVPPTVLRVCLDINVWVAYLMGLQNGRHDTAVARLVAMVRAHAAAGTPLQLSMSLEMFGTLERVLERVGIAPALARAFTNTITDLMRSGPLGLMPGMPTVGRDQLAMTDREDAGVLASCITDRVDLLVTDNLADFALNDADRRDTRVVPRQGGAARQLYTLLFRRRDGVSLAVAHPIDASEWLASGFRPTLDALQARYPQPV